jgi:hypothetical protein
VALFGLLFEVTKVVPDVILTFHIRNTIEAMQTMISPSASRLPSKVTGRVPSTAPRALPGTQDTWESTSGRRSGRIPATIARTPPARVGVLAVSQQAIIVLYPLDCYVPQAREFACGDLTMPQLEKANE